VTLTHEELSARWARLIGWADRHDLGVPARLALILFLVLVILAELAAFVVTVWLVWQVSQCH